MSDSPAFTEKQNAAMKDILIGWAELSLGDVSIICANWRTPGQMLTTDGSSHARFWRNLVRIGWAEQLYSPIDPHLTPVETLSFRLTDDGHVHLPRFLLFYDLLNMGPCTPIENLEAFNQQLAQIRQNENSKPWIPDRHRLIPAIGTIVVGLWLFYHGANPFLCFFLLTYSASVALLMHSDVFKGEAGRALRGIAALNAIYLAGCTFPLLFR